MLGGLLQEWGRCGGEAWSKPCLGIPGTPDGHPQGLHRLRRSFAFILRTGKRAQRWGGREPPSLILNFKNGS